MGRWIVQGGLTQKSNAPRFGSFRPDPLVIWRKWCDEYVPSSASLVYDHHKLYQSRLLVRRGEHYECVASDRPSVNPGDGCEMLIIAVSRQSVLPMGAPKCPNMRSPTGFVSIWYSWHTGHLGGRSRRGHHKAHQRSATKIHVRDSSAFE